MSLISPSLASPLFADDDRSRLRDLTADDLRLLRSVRGDTLITLLLATAPDLLVGPADLARAVALVGEAERRLGLELSADEARERVEPLLDLIADLRGARTGCGIALFAGPTGCTARRLSTSVEDRVVIDPTFATRDLARSLAANPPYALLVFSASTVKAFRGEGERLVEIRSAGFPMLPLPGREQADDRRGHRLQPERETLPLHGAAELVRAAARRVAAHPRLASLPLVVAAPPTLAAAVRREARLDVQHVIVGSHLRTPHSRLVALARPGVDAHLADERTAALNRLEEATRRHRVARGVHHVWGAARRGEVTHLLVDESFRYPAWTTADGQSIVRAFTADLPNVFDDAVDEIIEDVARSGGELAFVRAGELGPDGVAAVLGTTV